MKNKAKNLLDQVADECGLAVVVLDPAGREVSASNNNSICSLLNSSETFGPQCLQYCGEALTRSMQAGQSIEYTCHAGLRCHALTYERGEDRLVAITGRAFTKATDYRKATERAINGDWQEFSPERLFENLLLSGSETSFQQARERLESLSTQELEDIFALAGAIPEKQVRAAANDDILDLGDEDTNGNRPPGDQDDDQILEIGQTGSERLNESTPEEITAWRSLFGSLLDLDYAKACSSILDFLAKRYAIGSLLWLERRENALETIAGFGELNERSVKVAIPADEPRLIAAASDGVPLELSESRSDIEAEKRRMISLFPVTVGGEIRSVLAISGRLMDPVLSQQVSRFCRTVASQVEILRLRDEVARRDFLSDAVKRFNENLDKINGADFWLHLTQVSAELLHAERASLLVKKDKSDALLPIASIGVRADLSNAVDIGERVARFTLEKGKPVLVKDVRKVNLSSSPERKYRTPSFISYPIAIGERGVAVLNLTDKADGAAFSEHDMDVLRAIMPQIAVAIDRTTLKEQAGAYAQLSVTDSLTGLMNRRYIETRLAEEIRRSTRHGFPMSFVMLDVDDFKSYNDQFGHPAGDEALKMVGQVIKDTVRGADVAARYGGEEFAVLLPQTTVTEAEVIAERIRQSIDGTVFPERKVTVSIGIAACGLTLNSMRSLISAADKALYQAKRSGRNNVQSYGNLETIVENVH